MNSTNKSPKIKNKQNQLLPIEQKLKCDLNFFWNTALSSKGKNYFGKLSVQQLIELKQILSDVNNAITMKTALAFAKRLPIKINSTQYNKICNDIKNTHPNSRGFDVCYTDPIINIIAEVKCNIPADGDKFGQAQKDGIVSDIEKLIKGKGNISATSDYYKFLVLLNDGSRVRSAMENLKKSKKLKNLVTKIGPFDLKYVNQFDPTDKDSIYLVYIPINSI